MKKPLIVLFLFTVMFASAQEIDSTEQAPIVNKKGQELLPKQGYIGVGFNAVPMLDLLFNGMRYVSIMGNSAPVANNVAANSVTYAQANNQITGKYFLTNQTAVRLRFGVNTLSGSFTNPVEDAAVRYQASLGTSDDITAATLITVDDKLNFSKQNVQISVGYEIRRGDSRLQGYYGGEVGFGVTSAKENVEYGNAFSDLHTVDYTTNFNTSATTTQTPADLRTTRNTEVSYRGSLNIGVRGFIGVEYFIAPKISVGAEYGFGYAFQHRKAINSEREVYFNGENGPEVINETVELDSKNNNKGFSVDLNNGSLFSLNNTLNGNTTLGGGSASIVILFHF